MFSNRLKEIRKDKGLSMELLAEKYNEKFDGKLNKSTISRYENGLQDPMLKTVRNLAEFFGVSVDFFSDDETEGLKLPSDAIPYTRQKMVPVLGEIAAGVPIFADEKIDGYETADVQDPEG